MSSSPTDAFLDPPPVNPRPEDENPEDDDVETAAEEATKPGDKKGDKKKHKQAEKRFSFRTTAARILLGQAAFESKPYDKPHSQISAAYAQMRQYFLKASSTAPTAQTIATQYRSILASFRTDPVHARGVGSADQGNEFDRVWTRVSSEATTWEEEEKKGREAAEKKKKVRFENAKIGRQTADAIMLSVAERKSAAATTTTLPTTPTTTVAAAATKGEGDDDDLEAEQASQKLADGQTVPLEQPPLSFARFRKRDRTPSQSSTGSSRSEQFASLLQTQWEALAEAKRARQEEVDLRKAEAAAEQKRHEELAALEKQRLDNEAQALKVRAQEVEMQKLLLEALKGFAPK